MRNNSNQRSEKPTVVTRYISNIQIFVDTNNNIVKTNLYTTKNNKQNGEISVFDIDEALRSGDINAPYDDGDKRMKKPPIARADLRVEEIEKISDPVQLYIERDKNELSKHCNIKPFPSDDINALIVASKLVLISNLIYREL